MKLPLQEFIIHLINEKVETTNRDLIRSFRLGKDFSISLELSLRINHTFANSKHNRDVAQPGSAHVWGAWGRRFKSCHPDKKRVTN